MTLYQSSFSERDGDQLNKMAHYERISTMLTTGEVARLLNVHTSTVRRWSNRGIIKAYRLSLISGLSHWTRSFDNLSPSPFKERDTNGESKRGEASLI